MCNNFLNDLYVHVLFFIVVQVQLSPFSPHLSPPLILPLFGLLALQFTFFILLEKLKVKK